VTSGNQPPPSAGSGQEPIDNPITSFNENFAISGDALEAREGLAADADKP
jgi:hypothetical protein